MLLSKLFPLYVALKSLCFPLHKDSKYHDFQKVKRCYKIHKVASLPETIDESSGIIYKNDSTILNINDSGSNPIIYTHTKEGKLRNQRHLPIKNKDWEAITSDQYGNIYIGDFGNNLNRRKDLKVYKLDSSFNFLGEISFQYPDQKAFPPTEKDGLNFDCEAFFVYQDSLFLFSKNRGRKEVKIYTLPTTTGEYIATLKDMAFLNGPVTDAALNTSKDKFTLLSYGYIYTFEIQNAQINFNNLSEALYVGRLGQSEAISYKNSHDFFISNENGSLFSFRKKAP